MKNCLYCGKGKSGTEKFCLDCGHMFRDAPQDFSVVAAVPKKKSMLSPIQQKLGIAGIISLVMIILGLLAQEKNENGALVKGETVAVDSEKGHIEFAHVQDNISSDLRQIVEDNETDVSNFIESFRYYFEVALNSPDFSYIKDYFKTGSKIQTEYLTDIERHRAMTDDYSYDFQSTTITGVEAIDKETLLVNTAEMFYFTSNEDVLRYNKTKAYTVKIQGDGYYITNIKTTSSEKVAS